MSNKAFTSIPLVDIGGLYSDDANARNKVVEELADAASNVGFLYVAGHRMDDSYIQDVRKAAKEFFALPLDKKMENYIGLSSNHRGFVPEGEELLPKDAHVLPDHKEAFDLGCEIPADHPSVQSNAPLLGPNQWPAIPKFRERVQGYFDQITALGNLIRGAFALALGLDEDALDGLFNCPTSKLRLIHYPFDEWARDAPGIGEHTDFEWFTLLLADAPGLEVRNSLGEWIDAPPIPGTFILNIGDILEVMTAGKFIATGHRVRSVREDRYSFPFFYSSDYHIQAKPLPQFVDTDNKNYGAVIVGDHIWSQEIQAYEYLRKRVSDGTLALPDNAKGMGAFGKFSRVVTSL